MKRPAQRPGVGGEGTLSLLGRANSTEREEEFFGAVDSLLPARLAGIAPGIRFADNSTFNLMGNLTFTGTSWGEYVYGTKGNDTLKGLGGGDMLYALEGDDVLYGGADTDTLYGGSGADTFGFAPDTLGSVDTIADFSLAQNDEIDISQLIEGYDPVTHAITDWVEITTNDSDSTLKIDSDGGGNSIVQIATISGVTGLTDEAALVTSGHLIAA